MTLAARLAALVARIGQEFNALRASIGAVAITRHAFGLLAGYGHLVPGRTYLITDTKQIFVGLTGSTYLQATTSAIEAPVNLIPEGAVPVLRQGWDDPEQDDHATAVFDPATGAVTFTGGIDGSTLRATWTVPGLTSGLYQVGWQASGGTNFRPEWILGGYEFDNSSFGDGSYTNDGLFGEGELELHLQPALAWSGRHGTIGGLTLYRKLQPLSLSSTMVQENSPPGTVIGSILDRAPGSTLELVQNPFSLFTIDAEGNLALGIYGGNIDYESQNNFTITVRETLPGAIDSGRTTQLFVYVGDIVNLQGLGLTGSNIGSGTAAGAWSVDFTNTTAGSTLTLTNDADGRFAVTGTTLQNVAHITDETGTLYELEVVEELAGAEDSPRSQTFQIYVS